MTARSAFHTRESGFTLVELMVVIVIIALASAVAVLALPDPRGRLADEALRFAGRVRAAHDLAIIDARPVSVWVTAGGYGFDERRGGTWSPIGDKPLRVERWREGTRALTGDASGRVRLTFDATGLVDRPLDLRLARALNATLVRVAGDGSVRVEG